MKSVVYVLIGIVMITISGCSNPWNPYPYFNPIPTEDKPASQAQQQTPPPAEKK